MPVLGLIELIFIGGFFLLMVIATAFDRRHNEYPKWWVLLIGFVGVVLYLWGSISFSAIWAAVTSWTFWQPALIYLGAGLIYSGLEFTLEVRRMARAHADGWQRFISSTATIYTLTDTGEEVPAAWVRGRGDGAFYTAYDLGGRKGQQERPVTAAKVSYRDLILKAQQPDATSSDKKTAQELVATYRSTNGETIGADSFVQVKMDEATCQVGPAINKQRLTDFIAAWTCLWPAYAVSLILGDLMVEVFRAVGEAFSRLGGRFVRLAFSGTFKV